MLAILLAAAPSAGWSQRGVINYEDLSQRKTQRTDRDARKKEDAKKADDAKKKADEDQRRDERRKRYEEERNKDSKDDKKPADPAKNTASAKPMGATGSAADAMKAAIAARAARKTGGKAGGQPGAAGSGSDPTGREVTEVMLDAVRTQTVEFSVETAKEDPGMIMLNPPKFTPTERVRAGDSAMGQPL